MKYLIVGGVAGGASTVARLRRLDEHSEIVMFEKGAYISYANCGLPYYIGDIIPERDKLFVQTPENFKVRFNVDVRTNEEVVSIDRENKSVVVKRLIDDTYYTEHYDKLVLSPGAEPIKPPLKGIDLEGIYTLRNVPDTDQIKAVVTKYPKGKAVVIGGGFIGLEMAENLHHLGMNVSIIEMSNQIMAPSDFPIAAMAQQHIRNKGIDLRLKTAVSGFEQNNGRLLVLLNDGSRIEADFVILSIGVKPDSRLAAQAGLALGRSGGILVNEFLQTSDENIFAVGDVIEFTHPITGNSIPTYLAGPANKQGRICAHNLSQDNKIQYKGSIGTAIVKVFDVTVTVAGVASKHLKAAQIKHSTAIIHSGSHAGYYPGAETMTIQITFNEEDGTLYGAQIIGKDGVDKRIDILSNLIQRQGTVHDLTEFEHAYAPPFSSAKDPVNMVGFVAENIMTKKLFLADWDELQLGATDDLIVDVRTEKEFQSGAVQGAVNIPLDEIRGRLADFPQDKRIVIYCQQGLRGYLAQRILLQNNFNNVVNMAGGYKLYLDCSAERKLLEKH
ncbi:MAG: FAD-dependent oxidoreductase [Saprospiraceae bacterium]|nr:FAD-dependent oxidoreductase [Saprospiraceae bacterium]